MGVPIFYQGSKYKPGIIRPIPPDVTPITLPQVASATLLLDLRASQLALNDGDPVATWPDASGNGRDFTQTGTARPTYRAGGGVPYVEPDGVDDCMEGGQFADNLDNWAVFVVMRGPGGTAPSGTLISKDYISEDGSVYLGWEIGAQGALDIARNTFVGPWYELGPNSGSLDWSVSHVFCNWVSSAKTSTPSMHSLIDGVDSTTILGTLPGQPVTDYSTVSNVKLWIGGGPGAASIGLGFGNHLLMSVLIYQITDLVNWPTDRATIEAWLATNP